MAVDAYIGVETPLVSIVVVNHSRADLLRDCLESLLRLDYAPFEVLVVDNGSTDRSCSVVTSLQDDRIRLIALRENRGFAGGCNRGIAAAKGELVALLNNDAVAEPGWLRELVKAMRGDGRIGMCASKILFWNSSTVDKTGHLIYWDGQNRGRGTGEEDCGQYDALEETLCPDGCAALYRRQLLSEVGGFDEDFFAYGDDADLGVRARLLGWSCRYVPEAVAFHRHSSTTGRFSLQKIYWVERNRFWLSVKSFPLPLLLVSPFFTMVRFGWNLAAFLTRKGAAGNAGRENSARDLISTILRAYRDGLGALWPMWKKRRQIRSRRRLTDGEFYRLLWRYRISARDLAFKERA